MAKKDNTDKVSKNILSRIFSLRNQMNGIYKDTYSADPTNREELDRITSGIEDNLSRIVNRNGGLDNISNISKLYVAASLKDAVGNKDYINSITDFFENRAVTDAIISSYTQNKWIKELDMEIDTVCKYMPKLDEALNAIKDAVLCADNYEKEYLTFTSPNIAPGESSTFHEEINAMKKNYVLYDKIEKWYDDTSKYGEVFVYNVPYSKAINVLLDKKNSRYTANNGGVRYYQESALITESKLDTSITRMYTAEEYNAATKISSNLANLQLEIVKGGLLNSAVNEASHLREVLPIIESMSMHQIHFNEAATFDKILADDLEIPKELETSAQDGLIGANHHKEISKTKVPGALIKTLKRENMIMLYIDDICLGYYYLEFLDGGGLDVFSDSLFTKRNMSQIGYNSNAKSQDQQTQVSATDELLKYLSAAIANNIDDKFVNNNAHLKEEIYAVLKYNDICNASGLERIRVTYIAPEDVEHITFNEDPDTHRGISDLMKSLIPAKLWCCLYIANTIGILTRGQDKRVYYVKQNVEQNIAQTLMNVITQIKQNNFNIMQIENMNSILGITGKYNDYIIPVGPSGDAPISMEVMQGQDIDPQTELLDKLEETSVSSTGCPYELVVARLNLDFATQLTMSNTKFMRFVFKRQSKFEQHISNIVTKIYNYDHMDDNKYTQVVCILPTPLMLNINNFNQIMDLVNNQAQTLAEIEYPDTNDENIELKRNIFKKNYIRTKLGGYLKQNEIDEIKVRSEHEFAMIVKDDN